MRSELSALAAAVHVSGGLAAVAQLAQIDFSNLSKYLRTGQYLAADKVARVEIALGRPAGKADQSTVVILRPKRVNAKLRDALSYYFPDGAVVARSAYSGYFIERSKKIFAWDFSSEIYALKDHLGSRIVLILPAGLQLPSDLWGKHPRLRWELGSMRDAVLDVKNFKTWHEGNVTIAEFENAWPNKYVNYTQLDLIEKVKTLGITWEEAIRRVSLYPQK